MVDEKRKLLAVEKRKMMAILSRQQQQQNATPRAKPVQGDDVELGNVDSEEPSTAGSAAQMCCLSAASLATMAPLLIDLMDANAIACAEFSEHLLL